MPLDAICLTAVAEELKKTLTGGKIDKIYQPGRDEIVMAVRGAGENVKLLLSANPSHPRVQFTSISRENPAEPPMFCMLLRKHLTASRILAVTQPHLERVLQFELECLDELGDRVSRTLVLEALGRRSNLILLDGEGRITDCMRRVDADMSARRQVLPGMFYHPPVPVEKRDPLALGPDELRVLMMDADGEKTVDKWLLDTFNGLSPLVCRELAFQAGGDPAARFLELGGEGRERLSARTAEFIERVRSSDFTPYMLLKDGRPFDFSFQPILQYGMDVELRRMESFSAMLDEFYAARENAERVRQRGQDLIKSVTSARDRTARKLGNQRRELEATRDRERLRELGDIITSSFHVMEKGMAVLRAADFYDSECRQVEIKLDPLLTPQQNAAKYYKDYNRAKTAEKMLAIQIEKNEVELEYLNSVLENITLAEGEKDLQEIRQELTETGYLRRASKARGREKKVAGKPMEFRSSAGLRISVGKNNSQNDALTTKMAYKSDIWLHTQKIHGSHVILWAEGGEVDAHSLTEAAVLAATFSQAGDSGKVPVDYTSVKFVKKPAGARPGMVVYTTYQTAYVDPDPELAKRLRVK